MCSGHTYSVVCDKPGGCGEPQDGALYPALCLHTAKARAAFGNIHTVLSHHPLVPGPVGARPLLTSKGSCLHCSEGPSVTTAASELVQCLSLTAACWRDRACWRAWGQRPAPALPCDWAPGARPAPRTPHLPFSHVHITQLPSDSGCPNQETPAFLSHRPCC